VLAWLAEWRVQQQAAREAVSAWADLDLIFTNAAGGPLDRHNLARRHLRPVLQAAGLEQIRLYDLRHTFATLALSAGVPVKVVSEALGHASAVLTLDTYSHVLPHMQDEAAARVEALLLEAPPKRLKA
jgi:integrase